MKQLNAFLFISTLSFMAYGWTFDNKGTNPAINSYLKFELNNEMEKASRIAQLISESPDEVFKDLRILVRDGQPETENGYHLLFSSIIDLYINPNPNKFSVKDFRNMLFHEVGHYVFQKYSERHTATIPYLARIYLEDISLKVDATTVLPYGYYDQLERFDSEMKIIMPVHELFADVFRTLVLGNESDRRLSYDWSPVAWYNSHSSDPHLQLDRVRNCLWSRYLKNVKKNNPAINDGKKILKILAESIDAFSTKCQTEPQCAVTASQMNSFLLQQLDKGLN